MAENLNATPCCRQTSICATRANVRYWRNRWQVSEAELAEAVRKAGSVEAPAVAFALGKPGHML